MQIVWSQWYVLDRKWAVFIAWSLDLYSDLHFHFWLRHFFRKSSFSREKNLGEGGLILTETQPVQKNQFGFKFARFFSFSCFSIVFFCGGEGLLSYLFMAKSCVLHVIFSTVDEKGRLFFFVEKGKLTLIEKKDEVWKRWGEGLGN